MPSFSIWEKEAYLISPDVVIIGSGFSGLWSALQLKILRPHSSVLLLERGILPTGASTRNAGFSCFGSPSELLNDATAMGEADMWNLVNMRYEGIQMIQQYCSASAIDLEMNGGYECFDAQSPYWHLCNDQLGWLNEGLQEITGKEATFQGADHKMAGFGFAGFEHMIGTSEEGSLHPGKLVHQLTGKVRAMGVQLLTGVEVQSYHDHGDFVEVITPQMAIRCSQLLLCTNAFTPQLVPGLDIIPCRGQVIVTTPLEDLLIKGNFHYDSGYYYFRNVGHRLLIGGARNSALEEEETLEMENTSGITDTLTAFIKNHLLPGTPFTVSDQWAGIMGMGGNKMPIVEGLSENVFCCVRLSGMGVAL